MLSNISNNPTTPCALEDDVIFQQHLMRCSVHSLFDQYNTIVQEDEDRRNNANGLRQNASIEHAEISESSLKKVERLMSYNFTNEQARSAELLYKRSYIMKNGSFFVGKKDFKNIQELHSAVSESYNPENPQFGMEHLYDASGNYYDVYRIKELLELKLDDDRRQSLLKHVLTSLQFADARSYIGSIAYSNQMTFMGFLYAMEDAKPRHAFSYIANNPNIPMELRSPIVMYRDKKVLHNYFDKKEFEEVVRHNDSVMEKLFIQCEKRPKAGAVQHLRQRLARIHDYELNDTQVSQAGVMLWNQYAYFRDLEDGVKFGGYLKAKEAAIEVQNQRNSSAIDDFWYSL